MNATAKVLLRDGDPVRLTKRSVETLIVLVGHAGQVLTKEELIGIIWQGRIVDEANLIQNIAVIRRALGITAGSAGYIETFPGRGYRLSGPISVGEEVPYRATEPPRPVVALVPASSRPKRIYQWIVPLILGVVAGASWLIYRRTPSLPDSTAQTVRRTAVARLGGKESQPAISSDGKRVSFVLEKDGNSSTEIWIKSLEQQTLQRLGKAGWAYQSPAWSPDGKQLAFLRFRENLGQIVIAPVASIRDGTSNTERIVAEVFPTRFGLANRHLDWSADGSRLAFDDTTKADRPFAIYQIALRTGERVRLTDPPHDSLGDVDPRFSPSGRNLSFIRAIHRSRQELYTIRLFDRKLEKMPMGSVQITGQDWTSDEKSLIAGSNRDGEFRLWRLPLGAKATQIQPDWTGIYGDAPIQLSIARYSPDLVYSVLREDFNIWRLNLDLEDTSLQRWTRIINSSAQDASPQYSPDGRQICFRSDRTGSEQLWIADADGSEAQQITFSDLRPSVGRWRPDGQAIVFNDARDGDIYTTIHDKDGVWKIHPLGVKGVHPVFASDGRWIYAGRKDVVFKIPADGGPTTAVLTGKGFRSA